MPCITVLVLAETHRAKSPFAPGHNKICWPCVSQASQNPGHSRSEMVAEEAFRSLLHAANHLHNDSRNMSILQHGGRTGFYAHTTLSSRSRTANLLLVSYIGMVDTFWVSRQGPGMFFITIRLIIVTALYACSLWQLWRSRRSLSSCRHGQLQCSWPYTRYCCCSGRSQVFRDKHMRFCFIRVLF